jgi:hypothetical protein
MAARWSNDGSRERQSAMRVSASQTKWTIEIKPAATGERSWDPEYVVVQTAGSHAHVAPVLGIRRRWTTNVALVLGSRKLERKCTFWESCLEGGEGGLQGLVDGMRTSAESSKGEAEIRAGQGEGTKKAFAAAASRECFEVEERVAHAQGKQTNVFEDVRGGRSFVKLRCPGAFRERKADLEGWTPAER